MKTIIDYLKEHPQFEGYIANKMIKMELIYNHIFMEYDGNTHYINMLCKYNEVYAIQDILETYGAEVRFCEECGKPYDAGYTVDGGSWYCCEECFEYTMDRDYGKGKWRGTDEEGGYGGFYECLCDDNEWEDTGIYWTEWN
jgi:hypothetical protein